MLPDAELPFDRVCRVGVGSHPRVACGSAYGSVFVVDIKRKRVLGTGWAAHPGVAEELDMAATWPCAGQGGREGIAGRGRGGGGSAGPGEGGAGGRWGGRAPGPFGG